MRTTIITPKIRKKEAFITALYKTTWFLILMFIILAVIAMIISQYRDIKEPITPSDLRVSTEVIDESNVRLSAQEGQNQQMIVKIKGYTLTLSADEYLQYFENKDSVKTAIYVTTYEVPTHSLLSMFVPNKLTVARFSCLGQQPMSAEEQQAFKTDAANYLTQARNLYGETDVDASLPSGCDLHFF